MATQRLRNNLYISFVYHRFLQTGSNGKNSVVVISKMECFLNMQYFANDIFAKILWSKSTISKISFCITKTIDIYLAGLELARVPRVPGTHGNIGQ